ncbi:MAG: hypothetical protein ACI30R_01155 [Sodaliphilus sp.]
MNKVYAIKKSDIILADLTWKGEILAHISATNLNSIHEVVEIIKSMVGTGFGVATLNIRNKTQGWTISKVISTPNTFSLKKFATPFFSKRKQPAFATAI